MRPLGLDGKQVAPGSVHRSQGAEVAAARAAHRHLAWADRLDCGGRRLRRVRSDARRGKRRPQRGAGRSIDWARERRRDRGGARLGGGPAAPGRRARGRGEPRLRGRAPLLVAILKGAVPFLADLMRHLTIDCELDFMAVSSYGSSTDSSGVVRILKDLDAPIAGRDADRRRSSTRASRCSTCPATRRRVAPSRWRFAPCSPSRSAGVWTSLCATSGSRSEPLRDRIRARSPSGSAISPMSRPCGKPSGR